MTVPKSAFFASIGMVCVAQDELGFDFAPTLLMVYATLVIGQLVGRRFKLLK